MFISHSRILEVRIKTDFEDSNLLLISGFVDPPEEFCKSFLKHWCSIRVSDLQGVLFWNT